VLKIHTNKKGLCGPSQLTSEKLLIRMMTPVISMVLRYFRTKEFIMDDPWVLNW
jgi:hypothetical protein